MPERWLRYAAEGVRVVLVCATGGEEGDILNPRMDQPGIKERMAELRKAELETACDILGVDRDLRARLPGLRDARDRAQQASRRVHQRRSRGGDRKARRDHPAESARSGPRLRRVAAATSIPTTSRCTNGGTQAFHEARPIRRSIPDGGAPWAAAQALLLRNVHQEALFRCLTTPRRRRGSRVRSPGGSRTGTRWGSTNPKITTQVDVADYIELRSKALLAHATQIDPDSFWFAIPDEMQKRDLSVGGLHA